ncbi:MAG: TetR/AcrR family transcriptional regulator [Acidimicrobiales bacterium]
MSSGEMGRRERKKSETHHALRVAALRLCAQRGLNEVTVEEIADEADVAVRTFYLHYPSKEDAIVGFDASRVEQLRLALLERPSDEAPLASLRVVLMRLHDESSAEWPLRMQVLHRNPLLVPRMFAAFIVFERAMIDAIAMRTQSDPTTDLYPALVTAVATAAFRASLGVWRNGGGQRSFEEIFDAALEQVERGFVAPPAPAHTVINATAPPRRRRGEMES